MKGVSKTLALLEEQGLYPEFYALNKGVNEPVCEINGKKFIMFSANNYLGMTQHPAVKAAAKKAIDDYGVGPGGSRVISGNVDIIEALEEAIADLTGMEGCLTFPTGYMANLAIFQAIMDPMFNDYPAKPEESVIFSDEFNHGSIVDGCRLSKARRIIFKHDDLNDLEQKINQNNLRNKLIATEGVFSLNGEIIQVPDYIKLARKYDAKLMIDDAHGIGILGQNGGGVGELFKCADEIDVLMGCMDKAFGGTGGYLCGNKTLIKYLRVAARSSILSSALPTMMAGAMLESSKQLKNGSALRQRLFSNTRYLKAKLLEEEFTLLGRDELPAIALYIGDEQKGIKFSRILFEEGIYSPVVRWPAVPAGQCRLRVIVMTDHTHTHMNAFVQACLKARDKVGGQ